ncbi:MAG TPA: bifunctional UDP-N-acetylglucosamine diphosphorylase/glucosamine-1-phosphate N-acetyltransferase GlmU [Actinomycetota bacterium]|nr:bifunctional UDP-N-acetylglucosamine diphosphorylase/glucosamine-1-phosphate N-acetyltransferase GlmU [Actinomycetota bacterium]
MAPAQRTLAVVVLAAGEGKRFKSATPKVLHELCGRPLVRYVLDAVAPLGARATVVVVGRGADAVQGAIEAAFPKAPVFALQKQQLGTADAARVADEALGSFDGDVLILPGDSPLITTKTLRALLMQHRKAKATATLLSATLEDATGYGRIVRDADGELERIVEERDASPAERAIREANSSTYVFDRRALQTALTKVDRNNAQGEFYLTDVIEVLREKGERVIAVSAAGPEEVLGVNDRAQLAEMASLLRARINRAHMADGVSIVDPAQTYIEPGVKIGRDTVIHPVTVLTGQTVIGAGCEIGPNVRMRDSRVENGARVLFAVVDEARIGQEASVGPFAYLRPGARLARKAKVGTFVEVKNSQIGEGSKVPHLSYIGDATIGSDVNIGAASVTLNYDSETKTKSRTQIGDGAKIGGDTMMVAPVKIGKGAVTGASSVVTRDVPPDTVVYGAPAKAKRKRKPPVEKVKGEHA